MSRAGSLPRRVPAPLWAWALGAGRGTRRPGAALPAPSSVLVVRTDEIGDTVLTLPLLHGIRAAWPRAEVTVVVRRACASLLTGSPVADRVLPWDPPARGASTVVGQVAAVAFAARRLRGREYDLAVVPRRGPEAGQARLLAAASGARAVAGFDPLGAPHPPWQESERRLLTLRVPPGDARAHELAHAARLAAALGVPPGPRAAGEAGRGLLTGYDLAVGASVLDRLGPAGERPPVVAVALGAGAAKRRWPAERYAELVARVHAERPVAVVVIGGAGDRAAAGRFRAALPAGPRVEDTTGELGLRGSLAVLAGADLYVGGDTGVMHLAASAGVPSVVVSCHPLDGSPASANAPGRFGPWRPELARVLQPATGLPGCTAECVAAAPHCITRVDAAAGAGAALDLLRPVVRRELQTAAGGVAS